MVNLGLNKKLDASLIIFFLKTYLLNPINNPGYVVLFVFIVLLYIEGSLDKYHVVMMAYLAILSHYFTGNMFKDSAIAEEETCRSPITRYFQAMPISGRKVYCSYLASSVIYIVVIFGFFLLILTQLMKLPNLKHAEFLKSVSPEGDTITTLTGYALSPRGIPRYVSLVLRKSLLFDTLTRISGATWWISALYILTFVHISVFQVFKQTSHSRPLKVVLFFHHLPLGLYLLLGLTLVSELLLTQKEMDLCTRLIMENVDITKSIFLATLIVTAGSIALMSKSVLAQLRGR